MPDAYQLEQSAVDRYLMEDGLGVYMLESSTFFITLAATGVGVAAFSKVPTFVRTLAATAIGVPAMTRVATFPKTLAATAIGVATLARKQFVTMAATAIGVATMSNVLVIVKTLASVAVGVASLTEVFIAGAVSRVRRLYSRMRGRRGRGR